MRNCIILFALLISCKNENQISLSEFKKELFSELNFSDQVLWNNIDTILWVMINDTVYNYDKRYNNSKTALMRIYFNKSRSKYFGWFILEQSDSLYSSTGLIGYSELGGRRWKHFLFDQGRILGFKNLYELESQANDYFLGSDFSKSVLVKYDSSSQIPSAVYKVGYSPSETEFWKSPLWDKSICTDGHFLFEHINQKCRDDLDLLLKPLVSSNIFLDEMILEEKLNESKHLNKTLILASAWTFSFCALTRARDEAACWSPCG